MNPTVKITADNARAIVYRVIDVMCRGEHVTGSLHDELFDLLTRITPQLAHLEHELQAAREELDRVRAANARFVEKVRVLCGFDYYD